MLEELKNLGARFFAAQDKLKGRLAPELCAKGYTAYIAGNPPMDFNGHCQFGKMFYAAFPDLKHSINDVITDGNKVVVRFTLSGTHSGNFMSLPPTNKSVLTTAIAILHIDNNKVNELHAEFDQVGLMKQLGVIPEMVNN